MEMEAPFDGLLTLQSPVQTDSTLLAEQAVSDKRTLQTYRQTRKTLLWNALTDSLSLKFKSFKHLV